MITLCVKHDRSSFIVGHVRNVLAPRVFGPVVTALGPVTESVDIVLYECLREL